MTDDDIPPLLPPDQMPPVTDQASLHRTWRALMGELGFGRPQMWVLFLDDGGRHRGLAHVEDLPAEVTPAEVDHMAGVMRAALLEGETCAFLYCRPGSSGRTAQDHCWLEALADANPAWPPHIATDDSVTVYAPDDRLRASA